MKALEQVRQYLIDSGIQTDIFTHHAPDADDRGGPQENILIQGTWAKSESGDGLATSVHEIHRVSVIAPSALRCLEISDQVKALMSKIHPTDSAQDMTVNVGKIIRFVRMKLINEIGLNRSTSKSWEWVGSFEIFGTIEN